MSPIISAFTPCHDTRWLLETWHGLQVQNYPDKEWVILLNGAAVDQEIPAVIRQCPWVKIFTAASSPPITGSSIGALKKTTVACCQGDIYLELDADDVLVPGALPAVARAAAEGGEFIYSDAACFNIKPGGQIESWAYPARTGWAEYPVKVYGHTLRATACFPVTPRVLCEIYWAPDHLRAWTREAYEKVGGHDAKLAVGDDHDLICRTYIAGRKFRHTGGCHYLYRWHGNNTVPKRAEMIKKIQTANRVKYLDGLINYWTADLGQAPLILHVEAAAGRWRPAAPGDLLGRTGLAAISAENLLQFCAGPDIPEFFNAAWDALLPGGYLSVSVPVGRWADQHPLHRTRFNPNSFLYYTEPAFAVQIPNLRCRFDLIQSRVFFPSTAAKRLRMPVLQVHLAALKGQRWPRSHWPHQPWPVAAGGI
jgi:hypothetical protein